MSTAGALVIFSALCAVIALCLPSLIEVIHRLRTRYQPKPPETPAEAYAREVHDARYRTAALFPNAKYGVIHCPPGGCPEGYHLVPEAFSRAGQKFPGCVDIEQGPLSIDFLLPGESIEIHAKVKNTREEPEV